MQSNQKLIAFFILLILCFWFDTSFAQVISAPEIDTPLTSSKTYFYNGDIIVPFSSGNVGVTNNAEVNIFSTSEISLLPGFSASVDSGCTELIVGIRNCPQIFTLKQIDHISCYGKADGAIRLKGIGGSAPYSFNWWPNNKITSYLTKLVEGTYFVTVTDQAGCTVSDSISILEPPPFYTEVYTTPSSCHEASGSATISAFGGVGNYKYFWEHDGNNHSYRVDLRAGSYEFIVTDSNGCQILGTVSISDSDGPEVNYELLSEVNCNGYNTASVKFLLPPTWPEPVFPCGGTPNRLSAGHYPVIQEDLDGCITAYDLNIMEPDKLSVHFIKHAPTCGNNDGKIEAKVTGGVGPYTFVWNNSVNDSINDNLASGLYSISIVDANGCSINNSVFLSDSISFAISVSKADLKCTKNMDGQITVIPIGGTPPYSYRWFDDLNEIGENQNSIEFLPAGLYTIMITDNENCKRVDSIEIKFPEALESKIMINNPSQASSQDGEISVYPQGGVPPYSIYWTNNETAFEVDSISEGEYDFIIQDLNECQLAGSIAISSRLSSQLLSPSPCDPNQLLNPNYSTIQLNCTTCAPCSSCAVLDIVDDFGATPNDQISDEQSFEWAADFIKNVYCTTGVTLRIPSGVYIVGRQDFIGVGATYRIPYDPLKFCGCSNITIEGVIDPLTQEKPIIRFENCFLYGAFDPISGNRYIRNTNYQIGNVNDYQFAAYLGNMIYFENCNNIRIANLDLNGNVDLQNIGGYFATDKAGINLPYGGIRLDGCSDVVIENCSSTKFGLDGLMVQETGSGLTPANMNIQLINSKFTNNCRAGFHWNGGSGILATKCVFNYNGFGPWGGTRIQAGLEVEIDDLNWPDLSNGNFIDCDFNFNKGQSIICDAAGSDFPWLYHDFKFKKCRFVSAANGYSTFINARNVTFQCCTFAGQLNDAYEASNDLISSNSNTKFLSCEFIEEFFDPESGAIKAFTKNEGNCILGTIGVATKMVNIANYKGRVYFNNCKFKAARFNNWAFLEGVPPLNNLIKISNSYFYKERGDPREPTVGINPYASYNRNLLFLQHVDLTQNNTYFIPHSDPTTCTCDNMTGVAMPRNCWYAKACTSEGVFGNIRVPKSDGNGFCDPGGSLGSPSYCSSFTPDGFTDLAYVDPSQVPCSEPYHNPSFTQPTISIFPQNNPPQDVDAPYYWLFPIPFGCNISPWIPRYSKPANSESEYSVYPVPSSDKIHIYGAQLGKYLYIYNVLGQEIQKNIVDSQDYLINISKLQSGIYYVQIEDETNTKKIVKSDQ